MSSIQLSWTTKLLTFLPSHWFLYLFLIWFRTWVGKKYIINGFPQNSNILYKCKLMQLCTIFELCLQMTIIWIYFCLLSLPEAQKCLYLRDQIFYTNSNLKKAEKENETKYSVNDIDLLCFVIMQFFTVSFLKNKSIPAHSFNWLYWFRFVCVCVCACVRLRFSSKELLFLIFRKNYQRKVCPSIVPLHPLATFTVQLRSLVPSTQGKRRNWPVFFFGLKWLEDISSWA